MPYFKMVRKVKAAKKPGLGEILLSAMAGDVVSRKNED